MPRPSTGGARADAAVVLGTLALLGLLGGVLWAQVVTPAEFTKLANGGAMGENELSKQFAADAWYVVIGAVAGLAAGLVLSWWRTRDPVLTSVLLLAGAVVAAVLMALVGHLLGPGDPRAALQSAKVGARVPQSLDVGLVPVWPLGRYLRETATVYLSWPVGALAGALFVLLGRAPAVPRRSEVPESAESATRTPAAG
jgi:hypothetical protein